MQYRVVRKNEPDATPKALFLLAESEREGEILETLLKDVQYILSNEYGLTIKDSKTADKNAKHKEQQSQTDQEGEASGEAD